MSGKKFHALVDLAEWVPFDLSGPTLHTNGCIPILLWREQSMTRTPRMAALNQCRRLPGPTRISLGIGAVRITQLSLSTGTI